jgi:hypothetical protein
MTADTKNRRRGAALLVAMTAIAGLVVLASAQPISAYPGARWFKPGATYSDNFPDPSVVRDGSTFYAFGTSTGGSYLPIMTSTDLATWTAHPAYTQPACVGGTVDPFFNDGFPCPPAWGENRAGVGGRLTKEVWAPGAAHIGGGWVVFYSMRVSTSPDRFCIGVATSSSPLGPYVDNSSAPFQCDSDPVGSIDPQPFVDDDGTPYLIWKSEGNPCAPDCLPQRIWSRRLTADGTSFAPGTSPTQIMAANFPDGASTWENTVAETPAMVHFEGHYLLFYSGNIWHSTAYGIGWADCSSPSGPCTKQTPTVPLRTSNAAAGENGPGAAMGFLDGNGQLQLAFQYWNPPYSDYPTDPGCDGLDPDTGQPYCVSQGQRRMKILPVYIENGGLRIGGAPPVRAVARAIDDSCPSGSVPPSGFNDVPSGNVHHDAIDCMVWWGVANGTSPQTYNPSGQVNRAQMASFIARMIDATSKDLPAATSDHFPDDNSSSHEANINRLAEAGIVSGRADGTYGPNDPVTRAQMATFLVRAYEYVGPALTSTRDWFPDDNGSTHEANTNKAAEAGFAAGRADGTYAPNNVVTRDQMASFLARVLDLLVEGGFASTP